MFNATYLVSHIPKHSNIGSGQSAPYFISNGISGMTPESPKLDQVLEEGI